MLKTIVGIDKTCNLINLEKIKSRNRYVLNIKNKSRDFNQGCSCPMCGNPRKWFGEKTLQEIREAA